MSDISVISESLKRVETDIEEIHRPRLQTAKDEIDTFFDDAELRIDEFFGFFLEVSDTIIERADGVEEVSRSAVDILSAQSDRVVAITEQVGSEITGAADGLSDELNSATEICTTSTNDVVTIAEALRATWETSLAEAERFLADTQQSVEQVRGRIETVDGAISTVGLTYDERFTEATEAIAKGLNQAQEILENLKTNNTQLGDTLSSDMSGHINLNVEELTNFLETISGGFGKFKSATQLLPDSAQGPMAEIMDLVETVQQILDAIRPFIDLIDSLT